MSENAILDDAVIDNRLAGNQARTTATALCGPMSGLTFRPRKRQSSKSLVAGQRIVRKYRKFARNLEYNRLKSIVPSVANKPRPSKAEILEATIDYIDSLHRQLVESVQTNGLPPSLQSESVEPAHRQEQDASTSDVSNSNKEGSSQPSPSDLSPDQIIGLVKSSIQPDIEKRLKARKQLDNAALEGIMKIANSSSE